jgi:hypothetical protein
MTGPKQYGVDKTHTTAPNDPFEIRLNAGVLQTLRHQG